MSVFNSLGSNYSSSDIFKRLFAIGNAKSKKGLTDVLGQHFGGQAVLTYKGREALEIVVQNSQLPSGSSIGINGFTCFVVYQAIKNAGYKPVFIDIAKSELNFGVKELEASYQNNKDLRAIVIQNTLGYPVDMTNIKSFCNNNSIMIIEDLAHSLGAKYSDSQEAGTIGELTMLSFSQDKPLDVVAGGALIDRSQNTEPKEPDSTVLFGRRLINRSYPFWTGLIRGLYSIGIGRLLHAVLKKLHLLATPMSDSLIGLHQMDKATAKLVLGKWLKLGDELTHRMEISKIYAQQIPAQFQPFTKYGEPAYLRFAIWVENRAGLMSHLKKHGIYIADTWYDAPIAPKRYMEKTNYQSAQCPQAELLVNHIVNLPTHRHVSNSKALLITRYINDYLQQEISNSV